jgi:hypothetical protein
MNENEIEYYKSANWASLSGNFTANELREIAKEIEDKFKEFQKNQKKK